MNAGGADKNPLVSVHPDELKFIFELEKQSYCDLKVVNNTEHHVTFKVPTSSLLQVYELISCDSVPDYPFLFPVTLQAQQEYPPDMHCRDKFLLQSVVVPPDTDVDELPPDTFNKDNGDKVVEECKLRVVYISSSSAEGISDDEALRNSARIIDSNPALQCLKDDRDAAVRLTQQLQQELDLLKRRRCRRTDPGFSLTFAFVVGLVGIMFGFLVSLMFSSPSRE